MKEKIVQPMSAYIMLLIFLAVVAGAVFFLVNEKYLLGVILAVAAVLMLPGFFFINPNGSRVLVLFGDYKGTVKQNGFFWANPFYDKRAISLRARNFDSERIKVNDKRGNPVQISVILVWKVMDAYKAAFDVDNFESFVKVQTEAAVRHLAAMFSYDNFDDEQKEVTLRSSFEEVNETLERELTDRLQIAGIEVMEARIGYLAYAEEIANAMLKRQQAEAIVAARFKIVEGAVSMVELALKQLSAKEIIHLDEEKKAAMVSNLMVVLCSEKEVTPVVNTGTLYQ
jgi:regulator of protease activity HflC (stomatin/prohibitin superfamily)